MNEPIYNDWFLKEKIDGKIYLMARPSDKHIDVQGNIATIFNNYFRLKKKKCIARSESQLDIDDDNYLIPDVMVFCYNTNKNIPVIVVEILSKWTRKNDLGIKMKKYAELGIKEYWIIDWMHCTIDIYILKDRIYEKYESYAYYTEEDFSKYPKIRDEQKAEAEIIESFSPFIIPEMTILLEDVFYFVDENIEEEGETI